jgi:acetyl esterase/lipase
MPEINRRKFATLAAGAGMTFALKPSALRATQQSATAPVAVADPYALVDPELISAIKSLPKLVLTKQTLAAVRSEPAWPPLPPPAPQPVDRKIPGPKGAPDVRIVVIDPAPGTKNRPAFLHIHGGGYVAGTAALFASLLQKTAQDCSCLIVSVDYRLAPETRFPGSLEDNYAALLWLYTNSDTLGIDRKRIAIGGESAGGGHTAALAIAARDRKEIPIAFQLLIYPMLDDRTGSSHPVPPYIGNFVWTPECNVFGWSSILGVAAGSPNVPAGSVPARVENLAGLPPTFIGVGSIDLFVEEDIEYARRLINAGVRTELQVLPGGYHAFDLLVPGASISTRFTANWMGALKRAFAGI